jgi:hypothetical protein
MPASHKPPLLQWPEIVVPALLGGMIVFGVIANDHSGHSGYFSKGIWEIHDLF